MSAAPGQPSVAIAFDLPNATDNSHDAVEVKCFDTDTSTELRPSDSVGIGLTSVQCNATDTAGLVNDSCTFSISVQGNMTRQCCCACYFGQSTGLSNITEKTD